MADKRLYGAYTYGRHGQLEMQHVSHSLRLLERRHPNTFVFPVRINGFGVYERSSKKPVRGVA
jgi:hypothetical protein